MKGVWKWESFKGWFSDISVNSYGDFTGIGREGKVYGYDKESKKWVEYTGGVKDASAVALMANNEVFICRKEIIQRFIPDKGSKYKGHWRKINGCCIDIDSDGYKELIVIGCDKHADGNGIWRNLGGDYNQWKRILGQALTVGVGSGGHIVVSNNKNKIFWKTNHSSKWIETPGLAKDVTVGVGGVIVVIGTDNHLHYSTVPGSRPQFEKTNGMGFRVSAWSWRNPMVVGMEHEIWIAQK